MRDLMALRADADDAIIRAQMAQAGLEQARERLDDHRLTLEQARTKARARRVARLRPLFTVSLELPAGD